MSAARDEALITALWETHGAALLAYAIRVHGRVKAEKVVHDVLIHAWRQADALPAGKMAVRTWLLAKVGKPRKNFAPVPFFTCKRRAAQLV